MTETKNPCGLRGLDFVEFACDEAFSAHLEALFRSFGFARSRAHRSRAIDLFAQNDIQLLRHTADGTHAASFRAAHGPSISALGFRVDDAAHAFDAALARGATAYDGQAGPGTLDAPAVLGIGGALIYFVERWGDRGSAFDAEFEPTGETAGRGHGFLTIDHLTNNVAKGTLQTWADYYQRIFGFTQVRHFDIRGEKTGLYSFALQSPDGSFCIPINEGTEEKSQIEEYLREYKGPGVQHIAFLTEDLLASLDAMEGGPVAFLDIDDLYYEEVFDRVPNVTEAPAHIRRHNVLVDGDDEGYLLQIFTQNLVGPIFIELIQRKDHLSFGEGNFGALFRSIERDQERRGVL